ncbi:peptidoglycan-binding domain-containing protein [Alicyclobacillus sacchari]|uniref:peptidoglycan-binding domain-containing protein n=1 Tax=Alicyclobacillus sacchari TaxID=392010 RepID=UPI0024E189E6|nr:hypothetical protein [Alicyclobacillus sacchari]
MTPEERKLANQQRERRIRRWLAGLSWTLPAVSFGGFFAIWHAIAGGASAQVNTTLAKSVAHPSTGSATGTIRTISKHVANDIVLQFGDTGTKVKALQQQLASLGFFSYVATAITGRSRKVLCLHSSRQWVCGDRHGGSQDLASPAESRPRTTHAKAAKPTNRAKAIRTTYTATVHADRAATTCADHAKRRSQQRFQRVRFQRVQHLRAPASSVQTPPSAITSAS